MRKKLQMILASLFVLGVIILIIGVEFFAPYVVIMPFRLEVEAHPERFPNGYLPEDFKLSYQVLDIKGVDGIQLSNYLIKAESSCKGTIIMLHGVGACKEQYLSVAADLSKRGYDCLIFDARAHGKSEGKYCTYGFYEKEDTKAAITAVLRNNPTAKIAVWGSSMGGAVALQTLAIDDRIAFGIVESTFTELRQIVYEYQKRYCSGIVFPWICDRALYKAGQIANFDPDKVRPIEAVQSIHQPILMIHGDEDANINIKYGQALFDALNSKDKTFYTVNGGGHANLFAVGGQAYYTNVLNFIEQQFDGTKVTY